VENCQNYKRAKMKILLIKLKGEKPKGYPLEYSYPPLNLQILASLTPHEEVEIVDENFDKIDFDGDYDLVGITGYGTLELLRAKEVYKEFKKRSIPVVIGGPTIFHFTKDLLSCADSIVLGEGEGAWERVVRDAKNKKLKRVYQNKELVDLSKVETLPRRDLTKNKNYALSEVEVSRGCVYNCDYCTTPKFNRGGYRFYPIKRIIRDVEQCLEYPTKIKKHILFVDSDIAIKPEYKIKLFKKLIPYNIAWSAQCNISIAKNKRLLSVLAKSGCVSLGVGFESVNQESLESVNKPSTNKVLEYKKAIKTLHDYGIEVTGFFMFGLDGDKQGVAQKTLDFVLDTGVNFALSWIATPVPRTKFFDRLEKEKRILTNDISKYDGEHAVFQPKNMTQQRLEEEYMWFIKHAPSDSVFNIIKRILTKRYVLNKNIKFDTKLSMLLYCIRNTIKNYSQKNKDYKK